MSQYSIFLLFMQVIFHQNRLHCKFSQLLCRDGICNKSRASGKCEVDTPCKYYARINASILRVRAYTAVGSHWQTAALADGQPPAVAQRDLSRSRVTNARSGRGPWRTTWRCPWSLRRGVPCSGMCLSEANAFAIQGLGAAGTLVQERLPTGLTQQSAVCRRGGRLFPRRN